MKGGLCIIYTSLLTVSVVSSCALFILVVSEALNGESDVRTKVDLSGLHNVSNKASDARDNDVPPSVSPNELEMSGDPVKSQLQNVEDLEMTFMETLPLNTVTTDGLPDAVHPPILISLGESAKLDLKNPEELLFANDSEEHNDTKMFSVVNDSDELEKKIQLENTEPLVVKAKPMHEIKLVEDAFQTTTSIPVEESTESQNLELTEQENIPGKADTPQEDIPSFSEWAQKQLAEAEKKDTVLNHSSQPSHSNTNISSKSTKLRSKNYASPACGAKIVAVNPESGSASSILSPNRDEYMLNTCNSRIWFVVELCEPVQAQKIEIANFELFSSTPKDIAVYFSDRFPTRDWASVGQFTAQDIRDIQNFDLYPHLFGKFIKVEMLSHYGSEHYCPISMFKVYGTSEFEVLEKENSQHAAQIDEDDDELDILDIPAEIEGSKNLFGSARDAVMSIVKKAAQALVKTEVPNKNVSSENNDTSTDDLYKRCCSPSHIIVCDNCSESLYNEVYELISCSSDKLTNLVRQVFIRDTLKCTGICQPFGLDFKSTKTIEFSSERVDYMNALFSQKYLAALCNILAIKEKKVVLNSSFEAEQNTTNITLEEPPSSSNGDMNAEQEIKTETIKNNASEEKNDELVQLEKEEKPAFNEPSTTESTIVELELPNVEKEIEKNDEEVAAEEPPPIDQNDTVTTSEESLDSKFDDPKEKNLKADNVAEKPRDIQGNGAEDEPMIDSESLISDFDQIAVDPTPPGVQSLNQNQVQNTLQKESVFLRLSNRVKTLERNMSLSGQYLEELSRRYKKQVEEMQKTFEKTILQMTEERRKSNEREQKYLDQMTTLQDQMAQMASAMIILMEERDSWLGNVTFFKFIVFQTIVVAVIFYYISKRPKPEPVFVPITKKKKKQDKMRRKSVEGVSGHETPSVKKRRPSEEALHIARQSTEEVSVDDDGGWQIAKRNRRRKTSIIQRNIESQSKVNWGRQDSIGKLQETPIPLDEDVYFAPVSEPPGLNENMKKGLPKSNGSIFNNLKSKAMKTRRLSSPAFLRTFSRQSTRSNPSPVVRNLEPMFNGTVSKKAASESPTGSLWSESTEISNGLNSDNGIRKKKKTLKNIFKKVF